ncbi:MAG: hypothetical protein GY940_34340 [bacterium]|nr:hypothetical protein [bacterium]
MKKTFIQVIVISVLVFVLDLVLAPGKTNGSLLVSLVFWAGIGQGLIAISAATHVSEAKWIKEIRSYLHQYYPLLLLFPIAFLVFGLRHVSTYDWYHAHHNSWLSADFFIIRNVIALLLPFIFAHFYVKASEKGETGNTHAVLYLLSFVVSQSFIGYDQIMTFEYPWINTLFGAYFFIEAFYIALAFAALLAGFLMIRNLERFQVPYRDFVQMMMGFALFWGGMWFTQYIVIWYGNLPEEVAFVGKRMNDPVIFGLAVFLLITGFVLPFFSFFIRKVKSNFPVMSVIVVLLFIGMVIEKLVFLGPVTDLSVLGVLAPLILLGAPFIMLMLSQIKSVAAESSG